VFPSLFGKADANFDHQVSFKIYRYWIYGRPGWAMTGQIREPREAGAAGPVHALPIRNTSLIIVAFVFIALIATSLFSYLLFHSLVEAIISVIAFSVFVLAWTARRFMDNNYLMLLAVANLFAGLLGFAHLLAYRGMGIFPGDSANLPTQLWIATRYIVAVSLVIAPLLIARKVNWNLMVVLYAALTSILLGAIFIGAFPDAFIDGYGLTPFKIASEYVISALLVMGIVLLYRKREVFLPSIYNLLVASIILTIAGELMFTLYTDVYGLLNLTGHLAILASSLLIYMAVVQTGVVQPYDVIFRSLKRSEESLRSERDFAEAIITKAQAIVLVTDIEGRVLRVNPFIEEVSGWTPSDLVAKDWVEALVPEEDAAMGKSVVPDLLGRSGRMAFSGRIQTKSGGVREVEWRLKKLESSNPRQDSILFVGHDVTEEKRLGRELSIRANELARSNAELNQFAYVASHDLQEPLRMVLSYLGLLEKKYGDKLDGDAKIYIRYAVGGSLRMKSLITDLLAFSQVESAGEDFTEVDMNEVLSTALTDLSASIAVNNVVIEAAHLPTIKADHMQMTQLFQNLLGNAIKYHSEYRPVIRIGWSEDADYWIFSVEDNGIGIAKEHHERIFQMFHRLHGRDDYEGTGIGLAIAKRIVERHGGMIWVESEEGEGATFYFTIPKVSLER
jgi:PAS domain S-box-containing protein